VLGSVRSALDNDRVVPYYQSEISIESGEIVGFEALARIVQPDGSLSSPAEFVWALEDPDVGRVFGLRMIERVTRDLQTWLAAGFDIKRVAINVSNLELRADDYSDRSHPRSSRSSAADSHATAPRAFPRVERSRACRAARARRSASIR